MLNEMAKRGSKAPVTSEKLNQAVDAILAGVDRLFSEHGGRLDKIAGRLEKLEQGQQTIRLQLSGIKDEMKGLKAEFSDAPSRREFKELKARVDKYHPVS